MHGNKFYCKLWSMGKVITPIKCINPSEKYRQIYKRPVEQSLFLTSSIARRVCRINICVGTLFSFFTLSCSSSFCYISFLIHLVFCLAELCVATHMHTIKANYIRSLFLIRCPFPVISCAWACAYVVYIIIPHVVVFGWDCRLIFGCQKKKNSTSNNNSQHYQ